MRVFWRGVYLESLFLRAHKVQIARIGTTQEKLTAAEQGNPALLSFSLIIMIFMQRGPY